MFCRCWIQQPTTNAYSLLRMSSSSSSSSVACSNNNPRPPCKDDDARTTKRRRPTTKKATINKKNASSSSSSSMTVKVQKTPTSCTTILPNNTLEKRVKRYRTSCPQSLRERLLRAQSQRLYLLAVGPVEWETFEVTQKIKKTRHETTWTTLTLKSPKCQLSIMGSTGNCYSVTLQRQPTCTCPDFIKRQQSCKHWLFVVCKVLQLDQDDDNHHAPLIYQAAYLSNEVQYLVERLQTRMIQLGRNNNNNDNTNTTHSIMAKPNVQQAYQQIQQEQHDNEKETMTNSRPSVTEECAICLDTLTTTTTTRLTSCQQCGSFFHANCIQLWLRQPQQSSCPLCRQTWPTSNNKKGSSYTNLGPLQGQPQQRDTSTYYQRYRY